MFQLGGSLVRGLRVLGTLMLGSLLAGIGAPAWAAGSSGVRIKPDVAVTATDIITKYANNSP